MNMLLGNAAQGHADDMKARNFFDHVNPSGESIGDRVARVEYTYREVGENLLCGNRIDTPRKAIEGWLKSCSHRKTLLSPSWTEAGFGLSIARGKHCGAETEDEFAVYWVQNFGRPQ